MARTIEEKRDISAWPQNNAAFPFCRKAGNIPQAIRNLRGDCNAPRSSSLVIRGGSYRMNWSRGFSIQVVAQAPQASILLLMSGTPTRSPDDPFRYSAEALAKKHGISLEQAQVLIARAKVVPPPEDESPESGLAISRACLRASSTGPGKPRERSNW